MQSGLTLAEALAALPEQAPREHMALVEAGERSGTLAATLARLVATLDQSRAVRNEFRSRLAYPLWLLVLSVVLLPLYKFILGDALGYFLIQACFFIPAGAIAFLAWKGPAMVPPGSAGRARAEGFLLSLPWLGSLLLERAMGSALGLLGRLLGAGLPFAEAIPIAGGAQGWDSLRAEFQEMRARLEEKRSVSEAALSLRFFRQEPERFSRVHAGEKGGTLDRTFEELGAVLEAQCAERLKRAFRLLGIVGILLVGAIVLVRGLRTFSGLYSDV
jgi:general secretion pathway protein F